MKRTLLQITRPARPCLFALGLAALLAVTGPVWAQTLPKGAEVMAERAPAPGEVTVATGRWSAATGLPATSVAGLVSVQSWRMADGGMSTLALISTLRGDLERDGFTTDFACQTDDCGGFDFRFAIPALPEPQMHVDLGDFRYLVARRSGATGPEHVLILVSRGPGTLFAQITRIMPQTAATQKPEPLQDIDAGPVIDPNADPGPESLTAAPGGVVAALLQNGGVALDDLAFAPGSADLLDGDYASLTELGGWLLANPQASVVLVGHTDASGGLAGNVALSQRRAEAVRGWLVQRFELETGQIGAEGVGYLAPRASNDTDAGRAKNRRVEVMVTPTR